MNESPQHGPGGNARHPRCICGTRGMRDEKHDAYFCPDSGAWIERVCEQACTFCASRPPTAHYEGGRRTREHFTPEELKSAGIELGEPPSRPDRITIAKEDVEGNTLVREDFSRLAEIGQGEPK